MADAVTSVGGDLISKISAGGLSAGIFLLWWPLHLPVDGVVSLVLRGVLWTFAFEALLLAFVPLERMLFRGMRADRIAGLRMRVESASPRLRVAGAVALAVIGVSAPMTLLAGVAERSPATPGETRVVRQVIVQRPVVERRVVVREIVQAGSPTVASPPAESPGPGSSGPAAGRGAEAQAPRPAARPPADRRTPRDAERGGSPSGSGGTVDGANANSGELVPATDTRPERVAPVKPQPASGSSAGPTVPEALAGPAGTGPDASPDSGRAGPGESTSVAGWTAAGAVGSSFA